LQPRAFEYLSEADLPAGRELCISYLDDQAIVKPYQARRALLRESFLFTCGCDRCMEEERADQANQAGRPAAAAATPIDSQSILPPEANATRRLRLSSWLPDLLPKSAALAALAAWETSLAGLSPLPLPSPVGATVSRMVCTRTPTAAAPLPVFCNHQIVREVFARRPEFRVVKAILLPCRIFLTPSFAGRHRR
jgi:hypothetical protein